MPRPSRSPFPPRIWAALLVASALAMLASWVGTSVAGAQQSTTTRVPRTTRPQGPVTTADEEPEPERPPVTRPPQSGPASRATRSTAPSRTPTTRRSSGAGAGASTTMPTLPGSTVVPELLVAGPNNTATGVPEEEEASGVSAGAALWWVILALVVVGLSIAGLTVAFWRHTKPGRGTEDEDDPMAGDGGTGLPGYPARAPVDGDPLGVPPGWGPAGGPGPGAWGPAAPAPAAPPPVGTGAGPGPGPWDPSWDASSPMGAGPGAADPYDQRWRA